MLPSPGEMPDRRTHDECKLEQGEGGKNRAGGEGGEGGHRLNVAEPARSAKPRNTGCQLQMSAIRSRTEGPKQSGVILSNRCVSTCSAKQPARRLFLVHFVRTYDNLRREKLFLRRGFDSFRALRDLYLLHRHGPPSSIIALTA